MCGTYGHKRQCTPVTKEDLLILERAAHLLETEAVYRDLLSQSSDLAEIAEMTQEAMR